MKRVFVVILTTVLFTAYGADKNASGKQSGSAEQSIMRIEQELLDAVLKGDPSANARYMAENFVMTGPDGSVENKSQVLADLKSGELKLQGASLDDPKVQVYGDTAI